MKTAVKKSASVFQIESMKKISKFEQFFYHFSMQFLSSDENEINELNHNEIDEFVKQSAQNVVLFRFFI